MEKYMVVKRVGAGSFGTAWLAKNIKSGQKLVIKKVPLSGLSSDEVEGAKREGVLLSSITHPSVVTLWESFVDPSSNELCLVSEYCARGDLANYLGSLRAPTSSGLPESSVYDLASQIGLCLMWLHRRKMLHRDLKPANIFIRESGDYALGDFGIARTLLHTLQMAKTVVGTPYYLAPELCEGKPYSFKADVWSFGVILFEAACGKRPFEGSSMQSLFKRILRGAITFPPFLSSGLKVVISMCLQVNPSHRSSISEVLKSEPLFPHVTSFVERCKLKGVVVPGVDVLGLGGPPSSAGGGGGKTSSRAPSPSIPPKLASAAPTPPPLKPSPAPSAGGGGVSVPSSRPPTPTPTPKIPAPPTAIVPPQWKVEPANGVLGMGGGSEKAAAGASPPAGAPAPHSSRPRTPAPAVASVLRGPSLAEGELQDPVHATREAAAVASRLHSPSPPPLSRPIHLPTPSQTPHQMNNTPFPVGGPPPLSVGGAGAAAAPPETEGDIGRRIKAGVWGEVGKTLHLPSISCDDPLSYRIQVLRRHLAKQVEGGETGLRELVRVVEKSPDTVPSKYTELVPLVKQLGEALKEAFDAPSSLY